MNDPRWDEPRPEYLSDLDTVTFAPPRRPRRGRRSPGWLVAVVAFALGVAVGAGAVYELVSTPASETAQPIPTTTTVVKQAVPQLPVAIEPGPLPQRIDPRASDESTCDAHSGLGGPRFTAAVLFTNRGNVGSSYRVEIIWYLPGGHVVTRTIRRDVPPGMTSRARVSVPVTADMVAANQRVTPGPSCTTEITLVGTFGDTYR